MFKVLLFRTRFVTSILIGRRDKICNYMYLIMDYTVYTAVYNHMAESRHNMLVLW